MATNEILAKLTELGYDNEGTISATCRLMTAARKSVADMTAFV